MTDAVGYTRLSEDGLSIPKQKAKIRAYCEQHGLDIGRIYDDGQYASGYDTDDRPEYRELRSAIKDGEIGAVVVRDTGRIGRDFYERMYFVLDCHQQGVELHSVEQGQHNLTDPYKVVVESAQAAGDDVQKRKEIERAREAVQERLDDGCFQGQPPFGLRFAPDKCHLEKDPDEFEAVEQIIERRADGDRVVDVADDLDTTTATVSRVANRGIEWYQAKLAEYGLEDTNLPASHQG